MPIVLNGSGPVTGVTSLNTTVSDTEIGYLDGVTSALQTQINTAGGLVKITDSTFSAQSTVSVNNCFTSTYENYRIAVTVDSISGTNFIGIRLRASGTDNANSEYYYSYVGRTFANADDSSAQAGITYMVAGYANQNRSQGSFVDIYYPQRAVRTYSTGQSVRSATDTTGAYLSFGSYLNNATAYDGFSLIGVGSNTITGSVRVYGYRN